MACIVAMREKIGFLAIWEEMGKTESFGDTPVIFRQIWGVKSSYRRHNNMIDQTAKGMPSVMSLRQQPRILKQTLTALLHGMPFDGR